MHNTAFSLINSSLNTFSYIHTYIYDYIYMCIYYVYNPIVCFINIYATLT